MFRITSEDDDGGHAFSLEQACRHQRIAAIVAGTGDHQQRRAGIGQHALDFGGQGGAGAFHQRRIAVGVARLDGAQGGTAQDGRGHGGIVAAGDQAGDDCPASSRRCRAFSLARASSQLRPAIISPSTKNAPGGRMPTRKPG